MKKTKLSKKLLSLLLVAALLVGYVPVSAMASSLADSVVEEIVVDRGTADSFETMMGTDVDGNRYAGRVWADKSVYKNGDTAVLNNRGEQGSSFKVELGDGEAFQTIFSTLGSTMSTKETISSSGPLDVVLILDDSTSMDDRISGNTTRLEKLIEASNQLISNLLQNQSIRLGIVAYNNDAIQVLPFGEYNNGVSLSVLNNKYDFDENNSRDKGGTIQAKDKNGRLLHNNTNGYARGTNIQAGFDMGMRMLQNATNTQGRAPVAILLTDGAANTAVRNSFYNISGQSPVQVFKQDDQSNHKIAPGVALATILNAAFNKVQVKKHYGKTPTVYGVGVDLGGNAAAHALINPAAKDNGFNNNNSSSDIRSAYNSYVNRWLNGQTVETNDRNEYSNQSYTFTIDHGYKTSTNVTTDDIASNVNYVDTYYDVSSAKLSEVFQQIYDEISSAAFNPISSSTTVDGATGVEDTPLIYVDFIGQYMEVKNIQAVTLFGSSRNVIKGTSYTGTVKDENDNDVTATITPYTVEEMLGTNPTTKETYDTSKDIVINVIEFADGKQKLEIKINQQILPCIVEKVDTTTVGEATASTITEIAQNPLRVYYTVGVDSEILLPNGEINVSKIKGYKHLNDANGTVSFYSNQFGVMNAEDNGVVTMGDAHVGFKPSAENRYYYHQSNQGIFTKITNKTNGSEVTIPENNEYGIVWDDSQYSLNWMTYDEYKNAQPDDKVYTYVTYFRPTPSALDANNSAEEITYLIYADWKYLKESAAFYDANTKKYLNDGKAYALSEVDSAIAQYKQNNPNAQLYAVLGIGSLRTSRLHNMIAEKVDASGNAYNPTQTATTSYDPVYLHGNEHKTHNDNDVVVWLGNNGKLTVKIDTGIALTKKTTEPIGNEDDTYKLTVTIPSNASPAIVDENGNDVAFQINNNVLEVEVKANQTVYITGIPAGTVCQIGEIVDGDFYRVDAQSTASVTVPALSDVLRENNPAEQFAPAVVTNAPNKYGDLTIVKDIAHNLETVPQAMLDKVFTFKVQLNEVPEVKEYFVDKASASLFVGDKITVANDGSFTVSLKDNESITVLGLPENIEYTVTEIGNVDGYTNTTGTVNGKIEASGAHVAHFVNRYANTPIKPQITITGTKNLTDRNNTYTANEDFKFVLSQFDGNNDYVKLAETTAKAGGTYTFSLEDVLTAPLGIGNHYFRVTEESGNTDGMSYDSTRGLFVVRVTDVDADGTLEYRVSNAANTSVNGNTVTKDFNNVYDVDRTHVDINIIKKLTNNTGVNIPLNIFNFELVNSTNPDNTSIPKKTITTDASGKATIRISDLGPGVYTFALTEKDEGYAGMTYDLTPRIVTITVTNSGSSLQAVTEIDGVDTDTVTFNNKFEVVETSVILSGKKYLEGRELKNEFEFELYETDSSFNITDAAKEVVTNNGEDFAFSEITYDKVGTHYYSIKEKVSNLLGVEYDTTHYHVIVTAEANGNRLFASLNVNKIGHNDYDSGIVFANKYTTKPTSHIFEGTKTLHGRAMKNGEFSFELYNNETGAMIQSVKSKADGTFSFDEIVYNAAGTYSYTIKETLPSDEDKAPGVTYTGAENPITAIVTVVDDNAQLKVDKVVLKDKNGADLLDGIHFENHYFTDDAKVTFNGTKTLVGGDLADNDFTFNLYNTDSSFDIETLTPESTQNVNGAFKFEKTFNTTGAYYFVITEDATVNFKEDIVYDRTQHRFSVLVNDIGDGKLRATVTNVVTGENAASETEASVNLGFTNAKFDEATEKEVYADGNTTTQIDGNKVNAGDVLTYFITYTNFTGEDVVVDIEDTIPAHTTYVEGSASHNGSFAGQHLNWVLNVSKDQSVTVTFDVKVSETDAIVANTAVARDGVNVYTTNEVVNHTVEEEVKKDVFLTKDVTVSVDGKEVNAGDELVYKITYTNTQGKTVNLKVTDKIPANTTYVEGSADNNGVYDNGTLTWEIRDVEKWATVTVSFKVKVNADADDVVIKNTAKVEDGNNTFDTNTTSNEVPEKEDPKTPEKDPEKEPEKDPNEYTETEKPSCPNCPPDNESTLNPQKPSTPTAPNTGDSATLNVWFVILFVSSGAIITMSLYKRKEKQTEI